MSDRTWPLVTVVMPIRNEAEHLTDAVEAVLAQDYPGDVEVILAVGPSDDGTERVAEGLATDARVRVVDNPDGGTPSGLNRAIEAAKGAVVARADGHARLSPGYLRTAVELLDETGAWNVGGIQRAVGDTRMQQAVAAAMSSRFGTGDARFHYGGEPGPTDTVYLGVWPREVLQRLGGFDERLIRNQDYELNVRIRDAGGVVYFDPRLEATYRPRASLRALASQYWQYGRWKRVVLRQHPGSLRWRQAVPPAAVLANAVGLVAAPFWPWTLVVPSSYLIATVAAAIRVGRSDVGMVLRLPGVFVTMHHAWGAGFLAGPPRSGQ